jgi:hypothetical protein
MHKFHIGQTVFLLPVPSLKIAGGALSSQENCQNAHRCWRMSRLRARSGRLQGGSGLGIAARRHDRRGHVGSDDMSPRSKTKRLSRNWLSHHARRRFYGCSHSDYLGKSASNCLTFGSPCHADHRASNDVFADGNGARGASGVPSKVITGGMRRSHRSLWRRWSSVINGSFPSGVKKRTKRTTA